MDEVFPKYGITTSSVNEKNAFRPFETDGTFVSFSVDLIRRYHLTRKASSPFQAKYCSQECID